MPRNEGMSVDVFFYFWQVVKTRRGGEGVCSFQEGTDMVRISEDSNIATQGKGGEMKYSITFLKNATESQWERDKISDNLFELKPDRVTL